MMQKILVSACLLGNPVRYDGRSISVENKLLNLWQQEGRLVSFCPEVAAGLPTPRAPAEIINGEGGGVLNGVAEVIDTDGVNQTEAFIRGAQLALSICQQHNIQIAILSERSPSCGSQSIYDGTYSRTLIDGVGVTAALLLQHNIRVFNQYQITALHRLIHSQKPA